MHVQLLVRKHLEIQGKPRFLEPGDWVDVGRQTALAWVSANEARIPDMMTSEMVTPQADSGILALRDSPNIRDYLKHYKGNVLYGETVELPWPRTLIWNPDVKLRWELLEVGWNLLTSWQIAVPLLSYTHLAVHVGSPEERQTTEKVIFDLRVPMYDTRLMFVRRSSQAQVLLETWQAECSAGSERNLAFLRALFAHKPLILALPVTWTGGTA